MKTTTNIVPMIEPSGMTHASAAMLESLTSAAAQGSVWTWQPWSPHPKVMRYLEDRNIFHHPQDLRPNSTIVIPPHGAPMSLKKQWSQQGRKVIDQSTAAVRRAQSALALMRLEGCSIVVIGRRHDPETQALLTDHPGARVIEHAEDAVRIPYAPNFGMICQTAFDPTLARKFSEITQGRHRDSKVTFLDTHDAEEENRRKALRNASAQLDAVVVMGYSLSAEMLLHTAKEMRLISYHNELPYHEHRSLGVITASDVPRRELC